jgi:3-methylcrotonyl-CoA carboxylase alpha subunit
MIAKVIAHGANRDEALDRLSAALRRTIVAGPKSNVRFLRLLADHPDFRAGKLDTGLIEREKVALGAVEQPVDAEAVAAGTRLLLRNAHYGRNPRGLLHNPDRPSSWGDDPWTGTDFFGLGRNSGGNIDVALDGHRERVGVIGNAWDGSISLDAGKAISPPAYKSRNGISTIGGQVSSAVVEADDVILVIRDNRQTRVALFDPFDVDLDAMDDAGGAAVKSPMHGKVVALMVKPGDHVAKGQRVAVVEAMKMEHALASPRKGVVAEVLAEVGQQVGEGARVVVLEGE